MKLDIAVLQRQHPPGNDRFREALGRQLGRRTGPAARIGRPLKASAAKKRSEKAL